jgi:hypothetical protein
MPLEKFRQSFGNHPYRNVFFLMLGVVFFDAVFPNEGARGEFSDLAFAAIIAYALFETVRARKNGVLAVIFGIPAIGARVASSVLPDSNLWNGAVLIVTTVFIGFLLLNLLRDISQESRSTSDRIFGALCAYLFIGVLFALVYTHIEYRRPGSFAIPGVQTGENRLPESELMPVFTYYSFVTLTTLGYGDIQPVAEHARTLSWLEALIGQLFLAVMVAGFVAQHMTESAQRSFMEKRGLSPGDDEEDR